MGLCARGRLVGQLGATRLPQAPLQPAQRAAGRKPPDPRLQRAARDEQRSIVLRKLQTGDINPIEAAELVANRSTTATDIKKIFNAFEGDEAALQKIRGNYMERLIADFGDTLTTDGKALGAFAKRLLDANEGGKLSAIFGEEMGKDMAKFAKILDFNSRTAAGGDLVAANIAASPIQNLGKLLRFGLIARRVSLSCLRVTLLGMPLRIMRIALAGGFLGSPAYLLLRKLLRVRVRLVVL